MDDAQRPVDQTHNDQTDERSQQRAHASEHPSDQDRAAVGGLHGRFGAAQPDIGEGDDSVEGGLGCVQGRAQPRVEQLSEPVALVAGHRVVREGHQIAVDDVEGGLDGGAQLALDDPALFGADAAC